MKKYIGPLVLAGATCSAMAADITVRDTSLGRVYTDSNNITLYTFDKDTAGQSVCEGECSKNWSPLLVSDTASASAGLKPISRQDGSQQWALYGKPLYRWIKDVRPGDVTGAGVKNLWQVARADGVPVKVYTTGTQRILVNADSMALYTFDKDQNGVSACYDDCEKRWPPVIIESGTTLTPPFSSAARRDGKRQLGWNNMPLYLWFMDRVPGDITGDKVNNVWHIVPIDK